MNDIIEVSLHLDELSNVELLRRGVYKVACGVSLGRHTGRPTHSYAAPSRLSSLSRAVECEGSDSCEEPGTVDDTAYFSRSVLLRYSDERFDLNEGATFQLRVPRLSNTSTSSFETDPSQGLHVAFNLLRADFSETLSSASGSAAAPASRTGPFVVMSSRRVHVHAASRFAVSHNRDRVRTSTIPGGAPPPYLAPIRAFIPVLFQSAALAMLSVVVHVCHVDTEIELLPLTTPLALRGSREAPSTGGSRSNSVHEQSSAAAIVAAAHPFSEKQQQQREGASRSGAKSITGFDHAGHAAQTHKSSESTSASGGGLLSHAWAGAWKIREFAAKLVNPVHKRGEGPTQPSTTEAITDASLDTGAAAAAGGGGGDLSGRMQHGSQQYAQQQQQRLSSSLEASPSSISQAKARLLPHTAAELLFPRWHGHQSLSRLKRAQEAVDRAVDGLQQASASKTLYSVTGATASEGAIRAAGSRTAAAASASSTAAGGAHESSHTDPSTRSESSLHHDGSSGASRESAVSRTGTDDIGASASLRHNSSGAESREALSASALCSTGGGDANTIGIDSMHHEYHEPRRHHSGSSRGSRGDIGISSSSRVDAESMEGAKSSPADTPAGGHEHHSSADAIAGSAATASASSSVLPSRRTRRLSQASEELTMEDAEMRFSRLQTDELHTAHAAVIGPLVRAHCNLQATLRRVLGEIAAVSALCDSGAAPGFDSLHGFEAYALGLAEGAGISPARFYYGVRVMAEALYQHQQLKSTLISHAGATSGAATPSVDHATTTPSSRLQLAPPPSLQQQQQRSRDPSGDSSGGSSSSPRFASPSPSVPSSASPLKSANAFFPATDASSSLSRLQLLKFMDLDDVWGDFHDHRNDTDAIALSHSTSATAATTVTTAATSRIAATAGAHSTLAAGSTAAAGDGGPITSAALTAVRELACSVMYDRAGAVMAVGRLASTPTSLLKPSDAATATVATKFDDDDAAASPARISRVEVAAPEPTVHSGTGGLSHYRMESGGSGEYNADVYARHRGSATTSSFAEGSNGGASENHSRWSSVDMGRGSSALEARSDRRGSIVFTQRVGGDVQRLRQLQDTLNENSRVPPPVDSSNSNSSSNTVSSVDHLPASSVGNSSSNNADAAGFSLKSLLPSPHHARDAFGLCVTESHGATPSDQVQLPTLVSPSTQLQLPPPPAPLPFAARVAAAAGDPEAVVRALHSEAHALSVSVRAMWQQLQRLVYRYRTSVSGPLQARYRAAAELSVASACRVYVIPAQALSDDPATAVPLYHQHQHQQKQRHLTTSDAAASSSSAYTGADRPSTAAGIVSSGGASSATGNTVKRAATAAAPAPAATPVASSLRYGGGGGGGAITTAKGDTEITVTAALPSPSFHHHRRGSIGDLSGGSDAAGTASRSVSSSRRGLLAALSPPPEGSPNPRQSERSIDDAEFTGRHSRGRSRFSSADRDDTASALAPAPDAVVSTAASAAAHLANSGSGAAPPRGSDELQLGFRGTDSAGDMALRVTQPVSPRDVTLTSDTVGATLTSDDTSSAVTAAATAGTPAAAAGTDLSQRRHSQGTTRYGNPPKQLQLPASSQQAPLPQPRKQHSESVMPPLDDDDLLAVPLDEVITSMSRALSFEIRLYSDVSMGPTPIPSNASSAAGVSSSSITVGSAASGGGSVVEVKGYAALSTATASSASATNSNDNTAASAVSFHTPKPSSHSVPDDSVKPSNRPSHTPKPSIGGLLIRHANPPVRLVNHSRGLVLSDSSSETPTGSSNVADEALSEGGRSPVLPPSKAASAGAGVSASSSSAAEAAAAEAAAVSHDHLQPLNSIGGITALPEDSTGLPPPPPPLPALSQHGSAAAASAVANNTMMPTSLTGRAHNSSIGSGIHSGSSTPQVELRHASSITHSVSDFASSTVPPLRSQSEREPRRKLKSQLQLAALRSVPPSCAVPHPGPSISLKPAHSSSSRGLRVPPRSISAGSTHVVVFLNGLGGSQYDSRLMRGALKTHHPILACFATSTNQAKDSEGDIIEAAARIAEEVSEYLSFRLSNEGQSVSHLSFVAFSMGGLVLRLALRHPLLAPYLARLHTFISIAAPHMGLLYAPSQVMAAGIYLMQKWKGSTALAQLSFTDETSAGDVSVRNCLLYLLACGWTDPVQLQLQRAMPPPGATNSSAAYASVVGATLTSGSAAYSAPVSAVPVTTTAAAAASQFQFPAAGAVTVPVQLVRDTTTGGGDASVSIAGDATAASTSVSTTAAASASVSASSAAVPETTAVSSTLSALLRHGFNGAPNGAYMSLFHRVVLIASPQDGYAPAASCLVHWSPTAMADAKHGAAHGEMIRGFFVGCGAEKVARVSVNFNLLSSGSSATPGAAASRSSSGSGGGGEGKGSSGSGAAHLAPSNFNTKIGSGGGAISTWFPSLDSMIGREAHVAFLESEQFASFLAYGPVTRRCWEALPTM